MALTIIDKNLCIATMESAIEHALRTAGIASYATLERLVRQLRVQYTADPETVSEYMIKLAWETLLHAQLPSLGNLGRISRYLRDTTFPPPGGGSPPAGSGVFDGSATFDGSTTFDGSGAGASGQFDGSATFDGSTTFDGSGDDDRRFDGSASFDGQKTFDG